MIAGLLACLLATASAHPFGARFAAHLLAVEVAEDHVQVVYIADVPNAIVQTATRDPAADARQAMAMELVSGLVVEVDGESLSLTAERPFELRPTEDTQQITWTLRADLARAPKTVVLSNGNLPDVAAVYRTQVSVLPPLELSGSSLWRMRGNELVLDETNRWRTDERNRVVRLEVRRQRSPVLSVVAAVGLGSGLALIAVWIRRRRSAAA